MPKKPAQKTTKTRKKQPRKSARDVMIARLRHETAVAFTNELQGMLPTLDRAVAVLRGMTLEHDRANPEECFGSYRGAANSLYNAQQDIRRLLAAAKTQPVAAGLLLNAARVMNGGAA